MCPLHGTITDMNSCKLVQVQAKAMKWTCSNYCGGRICRVRFQGTKKHPAEGQDLNTLVDSAGFKVKTKKVRQSYSCSRLQIRG